MTNQVTWTADFTIRSILIFYGGGFLMVMIAFFSGLDWRFNPLLYLGAAMMIVGILSQIAYWFFGDIFRGR